MSTTVALVYSLLFGSTKFMFDFAQLLDELPAAAFFNYDRVSVENNLKFRYLLSKLVTLFITPHYHPIFPYEEPSYFGKFLRKNIYSSVKIYRLSLLSGSLPDYVTLDHCIINNATGEDMERPGFLTLTDLVRTWFFEQPFKKMLVLRVDTNTLSFTAGHATFLALTKTEGRIKAIYINPHGLNPSDTSAYSKYLILFSNKVYDRVSTICGVPVIPVVTQCPLLQTDEQGGNCATWELMLFVFFILRPQYFDDPMPLLQQLGKHPELNILLFSLSLFMKDSASFGEMGYYVHFKIAKVHKLPLKTVLENSLRYDVTFRNHLFTLFRDSTNCAFHNVDQCPIICRKCDGRCATGFAVSTVDNQCQLLTPIEIIKKMVRIDFKLHELNGTEYTELQKRVRLLQVNFEVPMTLQDYTRLTFKSSEEIIPYLSAAEVQEIEAAENSKKRAREQEELYERVGKRRRF